VRVSSEALRGSYERIEGRLEPRSDMSQIVDRIRCMTLLNAGDPAPSFYVDPLDGSFWELTEFDEMYRVELRRVDREHIEASFPTVDVDRPL
jgi:hypothetical protein